jgi:arylsulfatase A-like enzyme
MPRFQYARLIACAAFVGASTCTVDLLSTEASPRAFLAGGVIGGLLGSLCGSALGVSLALLFRLPRRWAIGAWIALGALAMIWVNQRLGTASRLSSEEYGIAWLALGSSLCGAVGLVSLGVLLQPFPDLPRGIAVHARPSWRGVVVALWLVASVACVGIVRTGQFVTYPAARIALLMMPQAMLVAALFVLLESYGAKLPAALRRICIGAALIALLSGAVTIGTAEREPRGLWHVLLSRPFARMALQALRALTDRDGDGYSALLGGGDCAPADPAVNPYAAERPDNGIDDNCLLGDAHVEPALPEGVAPSLAGTSESAVVLITVDALSAAHVGAYGYEAPTTPYLDRWSRGAMRFERAYTTGGWTTLALSSMFRGRYARALRWTALVETNAYRLLRLRDLNTLRPGERRRKAFSLPLDDPHPTLASLLSARGVVTAAVVDDGHTHVFDAALGGFPGFRNFETMPMRERRAANDEDVSRRAIDVLRALRKGPPFFLWVHYFGPHAPDSTYAGTPRFQTGRASGYDHEIAHTDAQLGLLLAAIDAERKRRSIAVIVTADHGESVHRTWHGHGLDLTEAALRVPLFVRADGLAPGSTPALASLIDVMPTVLDLMGTPRTSSLDGTNLVTLARTRKPRVVFSDTWRQDTGGPFIVDLAAAFDGTMKIVHDGLAADEWMSLQSDPAEADQSERLDAPKLRAALDRYLERYGHVRVGM